MAEPCFRLGLDPARVANWIEANRSRYPGLIGSEANLPSVLLVEARALQRSIEAAEGPCVWERTARTWRLGEDCRETVLAAALLHNALAVVIAPFGVSEEFLRRARKITQVQAFVPIERRAWYARKGDS